ncbi:MAG TPA: DUF4169 family protein [Xanthobacteraceae bacterium]|nr:DUF4169 family protein [Xanthobacteraceae bacterium]
MASRPPYPVTPSPLMAEIVNLRIARKRAKRRQTDHVAAENRVAHGRTKTERTQTRSRNDQAQRSLDLHRIETGDGQ